MIASGLKRKRLPISLLVLMIAIFAAAPAGASDGAVWMTVGSTGTVDELGRDSVVFDGPVVTLKKNVGTPAPGPPFPVIIAKVIRYNIPPLAGLNNPPCVSLFVRYRDGGSGQRIVVTLKQLNISSGTVANLRNFDSDSFPADADFQHRSSGFCGPIPFDFEQNAYFAEVKLYYSYSDTSEPPAVAAIHLSGGSSL